MVMAYTFTCYPASYNSVSYYLLPFFSLFDFSFLLEYTQQELTLTLSVWHVLLRLTTKKAEIDPQLDMLF